MASMDVLDPSDIPQSPLLSLLEDQRLKKDVRVFAHAAAETQIAIKESFRVSANSRLPDSLVYGTNEPGFLEVFPRVASRPPKLLQELESVLVDRLRTNDKAASLTPIGSAKDRDPKLSANLSLDAHRQVFNAFVTGFSTYAPLLSRIQVEFDRALNEGVHCAQDNVEMRYKMAQNELERERAVAEVRGQVLSEDLQFRSESLTQLQELNDRLAKALKKKSLAEKDLREALAEEERLQALLEQLQAAQAQLQAIAGDEAKWRAQPMAPHLTPLTIGPLTPEDEDFLEQELGALLGIVRDGAGGGGGGRLETPSTARGSVASLTAASLGEGGQGPPTPAREMSAFTLGGQSDAASSGVLAPTTSSTRTS